MWLFGTAGLFEAPLPDAAMAIPPHAPAAATAATAIVRNLRLLIDRESYYGSAASRAATTSSASGGTGGWNRATTSPSGETRNFSKFHSMSPAGPSA